MLAAGAAESANDAIAVNTSLFMVSPLSLLNQLRELFYGRRFFFSSFFPLKEFRDAVVVSLLLLSLFQKLRAVRGDVVEHEVEVFVADEHLVVEESVVDVDGVVLPVGLDLADGRELGIPPVA